MNDYDDEEQELLRKLGHRTLEQDWLRVAMAILLLLGLAAVALMIYFGIEGLVALEGLE